MSSQVPPAVVELLEQQKQLITPAQARRAGVHGSTLAGLTKSGVLALIDRRVYGRVGVEMTWERHLLATLLGAGPPAVASHRAVARLLGLATYEGAPLEITVPSKRSFTRPGVIVHQSRDLAYIPPVHLRGIPSTPPRRLAVDIGAVLGETAYTTVMRDLRRDHGVSWKQLAAVLELHSRRGRNGCGPLRRQLERYYGLDGIPDTTLEQQFLDLLIDAGYPMPVCQHIVERPGRRPFRLDFAFLDLWLDVEIDGPHHRIPEVAARDRRRDAVLERLGWKVLRFDEEAIVYAPAAVLGELRRTLQRLGPRIPPADRVPGRRGV